MPDYSSDLPLLILIATYASLVRWVSGSTTGVIATTVLLSAAYTLLISLTSHQMFAGMAIFLIFVGQDSLAFIDVLAVSVNFMARMIRLTERSRIPARDENGVIVVRMILIGTGIALLLSMVSRRGQ